LGKTQQQTTWSVFVLWIIFDNPGIRAGLDDFLVGYVALYGALEGVAGEFEFTLANLSQDMSEILQKPLRNSEQNRSLRDIN
jgi:hypothetical protein